MNKIYLKIYPRPPPLLEPEERELPPELRIDPELLDPDDRETLLDLLVVLDR